jgi:hypothetical protein
MKLNDAQQENLALRLAECVVEYWLEKAKEDPESARQEGQQLLNSLEQYPDRLKQQDLDNRQHLSRRLLGLPSFLRVVQRNPLRVLKWEKLPPSPSKNEQAEFLWAQQRLH